MAQEELFNQGVEADFDDNDRIAASVPGAKGAKNMLWSAFKAKVISWFPDISFKANKDSTGLTSGDITAWQDTLSVIDADVKANKDATDMELAEVDAWKLLLGVGDYDVSGKMDKISLPSSTQELQLLSVDGNGQAIYNPLYSSNLLTTFLTWLASDVSGTFLLSEFLILSTQGIALGAGTKRIINESALIVLNGEITINTSGGNAALVIENHIYLNVSSKIIYNSNTTDLDIAAKYTTGATGEEILTIENTGSNIVNYKYANWDGNIVVTGSNTLTFSNDVFSPTHNVKQITSYSSVDFKTQKVYSTSATPSISNVLFDQTNARLGIVQKIYHNHSVAPTFTGVTDVQIVSQGQYIESTLNIIFAEWVAIDRVEYWIVQEG